MHHPAMQVCAQGTEGIRLCPQPGASLSPGRPPPPPPWRVRAKHLQRARPLSVRQCTARGQHTDQGGRTPRSLCGAAHQAASMRTLVPLQGHTTAHCRAMTRECTEHGSVLNTAAHMNTAAHWTRQRSAHGSAVKHGSAVETGRKDKNQHKTSAVNHAARPVPGTDPRPVTRPVLPKHTRSHQVHNT